MGQIVLAYHGCDVTVRDGLVRGELTPRISSNAYDWLGDGLYFFEGDHNRALKLAMFAHENPQHLLTRIPIATPAVVGAILDVDRWLDLTTQEGIANFTHAAQTVVNGSFDAGTPVPKNKPAFDGDKTSCTVHLTKRPATWCIPFAKCFTKERLMCKTRQPSSPQRRIKRHEEHSSRVSRFLKAVPSVLTPIFRLPCGT